MSILIDHIASGKIETQNSAEYSFTLSVDSEGRLNICQDVPLLTSSGENLTVDAGNNLLVYDAGAALALTKGYESSGKMNIESAAALGDYKFILENAE